MRFSLVSALRKTGSLDAAWKEGQEEVRRTRIAVARLALPGKVPSPLTRHTLQSSVGLGASHARAENGWASSVVLPTAFLWDHRGNVSLGSPEKTNGRREPPPPLPMSCSIEVTERPVDIHTDTQVPSITAGPTCWLLPCASADRGGYPKAARLSKKGSYKEELRIMGCLTLMGIRDRNAGLSPYASGRAGF